jgi:hypothetical protein
MEKPRIFLGSSGKQEKLLQALTRGLEDVAHVEPWTTSFNPGTTTLERLLELTQEVDFAAFVFRYGEATTATEMRVVCQKLRKAMENEGRVARIEGLWWQFSLTERSSIEPSAVSLLRISRDRDGALELAAAHGKRMAPFQRDTGAKQRRSETIPPASSTTGRVNGLGTRTHLSWTERERSESSPPIAQRDTSRLIRRVTRRSTRGRPVCTCAPILRT